MIAGPGIDVKLPSNSADTFTHRVILNSIVADGPARAKIGGFMGTASAYLACNFCFFSGERDHNHTTFKGYLEPSTMQAGPFKGHDYQIGVNNDAVKLSHDCQVVRAAQVDSLFAPPAPGARAATKKEIDSKIKHFGCHYTPEILSRLPYLDRNNVFVLPFYHMAGLGLVKDFLGVSL